MAVESKYDEAGNIVEEAKKPIMQRMKASAVGAWKSKPPSEWGQLFACFFVFYCFMSGWMAIHMYVMNANLPDRVVWEHNTLALGEPRSTRFMVSGLVTANRPDESEDENKPDWQPVAFPWAQGNGAKVPIKNRDIYCQDIGLEGSCHGFQQLRTLNQFSQRQLAMDLDVTCFVTEIEIDGTTVDQSAVSTTWTDFSDPLANNGRDFPVAQPDKVPTHSVVAYSETDKTQFPTELETDFMVDEKKIAPKEVLHIKFHKGAFAPHFTQFKVGVKDVKKDQKEVKVFYSCQVQFFPDVNNVFQFDDNLGEDSNELADISGIDTVNFEHTYHFDEKAPQ